MSIQRSTGDLKFVCCLSHISTHPSELTNIRQDPREKREAWQAAAEKMNVSHGVYSEMKKYAPRTQAVWVRPLGFLSFRPGAVGDWTIEAACTSTSEECFLPPPLNAVEIRTPRPRRALLTYQTFRLTTPALTRLCEASAPSA